MPFIKNIPGILFATVVALVAIEMSSRYPALGKNGLSILTLAILIGIAIGNMPIYKFLISYCGSGINFSKQRVLRLGIILYGFRLTFQDIGDVGIGGIVIDVIMLTSTFVLAVYLGMKYFKLDRDTSFLIGAGSSICGAAAILATEPILKASNERVAVAISTIVIFGTISIFIYPIIYSYALLHYAEYCSPEKFGIFIGSTVHEVAQVVATADAIGDEVTNIAVIAKMVRVMMLAPFLIVIATFVSFSEKASKNSAIGGKASRDAKKSIGKFFPVFAIFFLIAIGINSTGYISEPIRAGLTYLDNFLLALAMGALGLTTHLSAVAKAGIKPLKLAAILFAWLVIGGMVINIAVSKLL
ncbi:YeiH family protein [Polynucleobacter sp. AP-Reno-20A-A9]|uniref:YeiH family protein n=1 Tax=Polynucleobacter sp. AP-Reno-20A-A9 TaxID=2576925 RepID=UPI001C0D4A27|nr:YeiH family protein [Polynucleobacter sp. AP-Reno-20A-A9]MBU3628191.1 YeiH family putative sulfate export transporter [Polynucleobacter sp. AP-Reno-20A-A9]